MENFDVTIESPSCVTTEGQIKRWIVEMLPTQMAASFPVRVKKIREAIQWFLLKT